MADNMLGILHMTKNEAIKFINNNSEMYKDALLLYSQMILTKLEEV